MQPIKYFSLDEAEQALPRVRRLLDKLQKLKLQVNILAEEKEAPIQLTEPFTEEEIYQFAFIQEIKLNKELHKHVHDFFKTLDEMNEIGCIIKDLDEGLIDFYHKMNSRDVLLCWKKGEKQITHWHETETGYAQRKPIIDIDSI
jgi:hypothetical protein